ncbi:MAG TPA: cation:proton antiporter [Caldilineaceae bacterium]|nr:cation:proton antiporter [Caldilineaceae bacterium]
MAEEIVLDLFLICLTALVFGLVADRLHLPPPVGYVVAGIAIGPYTGGPTISHLPLIGILAEVGLALWLFILGIEFSLKDLHPVRRLAWVGTPLQMLLSGACGYALALWMGWSGMAALWFSVLVSLSSVVMAPRLLTVLSLPDETAHRLMTGLLTVQNLLVVPLVLVLYTLGRGEGNIWGVGVAVTEGLLILAVLLFIGTQIIPRIVTWFGGPSAELSNQVVLTCAVLIGVGAYVYGLPFVFVAFAIGLSLSGSEQLSPMLRTILPYRALFGVLFFVSMGMLLDIHFLPEHAGPLMVVAGLSMIAKGVILFLIVRTFGYSATQALLVGLTLSQIGELALILVRLGAEVGIFAPVAYTFGVASVLLSLLVTPFLTALYPPLARRFRERGMASS